jgi:hypothetical protein
LNLAQSSLKSGHTLDAAKDFVQLLHEQGATDVQRTDATRGLNEARAKLGRIDVAGVAAGTDVFVDDERIGVTPLDHSIDVEPGTHTVRAHDQTVQVTAMVGQPTVARFGATAASVAAAPPPPSSATTSSEEPPAAPIDLSPEPADPGSQGAAASPPPPASSGAPGALSPPAEWGWVVLGGSVTVAAFATAIAMGIEKGSAQNSANTLDAEITQQTLETKPTATGACYNPTSAGGLASACSALSSDNDHVNTDALIANIAIGVGAAAATFTVLYYLFGTKKEGSSSPPPASASSPQLAPMIGKGSGGLTLGVSF